MTARLWEKMKKQSNHVKGSYCAGNRAEWPLEVVYEAPCFWVGRCFLLCISEKTLGFVILALGWQVLGDGLQLGDVADSFGHALSEEQLRSYLQVFRVLDELKEDHCFLTCPQLLL